jgi:hypothetical protein
VWNRAALVTSVALSLLASQPGCAFVAYAEANHVHAGCVESPGFGIVDLGIAAAAGLTLVATEAAFDHPWTLAIPGVFAASGTIGIIAAHDCRARTKPRVAKDIPVYMDPKPQPPAEEDLLPDATIEELPTPQPAPTPAPADLQVDPSHAAPPDPANQGKQACGMQPPRPCPAGQSCVITKGTDGYCAADD